MSEGGNEARLERIQGGVDLINERLQHANRISDERHEAIKVELIDIRRIQHKHGNEIGNLQAAEHKRAGERAGLTMSGRVVWGAITVALSGGTVAVLKLLLP